jgi:hypothetical protein
MVKTIKGGIWPFTSNAPVAPAAAPVQAPAAAPVQAPGSPPAAATTPPATEPDNNEKNKKCVEECNAKFPKKKMFGLFGGKSRRRNKSKSKTCKNKKRAKKTKKNKTK